MINSEALIIAKAKAKHIIEAAKMKASAEIKAAKMKAVKAIQKAREKAKKYIDDAKAKLKKRKQTGDDDSTPDIKTSVSEYLANLPREQKASINIKLQADEAVEKAAKEEVEKQQFDNIPEKLQAVPNLMCG